MDFSWNNQGGIWAIFNFQPNMTWHLFPWNAWLLLRDQTTFWWDPYILMAKITSPSITWAAYRIPYSVGYDFFQTSGNIPHIPHVKTKQLEQEWTKLKQTKKCVSKISPCKPCLPTKTVHGMTDSPPKNVVSMTYKLVFNLSDWNWSTE